MAELEGAWVFVDGNNLMGARPDGWWRDRRGAQRRAVAQLADVARRLGGRWAAVFDGAPAPGFPGTGGGESGEGALRVEFAAKRGRDGADDRIVALLGEAPAGVRAIVYTSDRGLRERARALGAEVEGVSGLLRLMGDSSGLR